MRQDSSDPTGVNDEGKPGTKVTRARDRKAAAALQMRLSGAEWEDIAQVLGYPTPRAALVAYESAMEKQLETPESREELRRLARLRYERLLRGIWAKAIDPKDPEHLAAATKAKEIISQITRLEGSEAPQEVAIYSPSASELETWVAEQVNRTVPQLEEADIFEEGEDIVDAEIKEAG
jgi:anti-sigma factor RsiW